MGRAHWGAGLVVGLLAVGPARPAEPAIRAEVDCPDPPIVQA
jgi:hypothetical protein